MILDYNKYKNIKNILILCANNDSTSNLKGLNIIRKFFDLKHENWHYLNMVYVGNQLDVITHLKTSYIKINKDNNFDIVLKRMTNKYDFEIVSSNVINLDLKELTEEDFKNILHNAKFDIILNEFCPMLDGHSWTFKPEHLIKILNTNLKSDGYYIDSLGARKNFTNFKEFYTDYLNEELIDDIDGRHILFSKNNLNKLADGLKKMHKHKYGRTSSKYGRRKRKYGRSKRK